LPLLPVKEPSFAKTSNPESHARNVAPRPPLPRAPVAVRRLRRRSHALLGHAAKGRQHLQRGRPGQGLFRRAGQDRSDLGAPHLLQVEGRGPGFPARRCRRIPRPSGRRPCKAARDARRGERRRAEGRGDAAQPARRPLEAAERRRLRRPALVRSRLRGRGRRLLARSRSRAEGPSVHRRLQPPQRAGAGKDDGPCRERHDGRPPRLAGRT